jgi:23S rRNA (guanine2445-N2)-methyltransferase / 23S rRNA (guanine2069-N7)-methyltransferase
VSGLRFLASVPRGLADLLATELAGLGAEDVRERTTHVEFGGSLESGYRACLESRLANRIFLEIARFEAPDADAYYAEARSLEWSRHLAPGATLACDFSGNHPAITHSHFGALRLKDAIVDALRERTGSRPDIVTEQPDVRVHAHADGVRIALSIDLSGESLHRRGYRAGAGEAPLKENVAAGILVRAGWAQLAQRGAEFLDPMCGSGTLVIEAALIAAGCAPALRRSHFGFLGWRGHEPALWQRVRSDAEGRCKSGEQPSVLIRGQDIDPAAVRMARANAERAGVAGWVSFEARPLSAAAPAASPAADPREAAGLLCTNPPYGVRLQEPESARAVHRELGAVLRARFTDWTAAILTGAPELGMELGLRAARTHALWNGPIECRLLRIRIEPASVRSPGSLRRPDPALRESAGARMFANRLSKNLKRLQGWARRAQVSCYRLYDADMPEYAFAIDLYRTLDPDELWLYVQEYAAPATVDPEAARRRRAEALAVLPEVTGVPPARIRVRTRRRTRRGEQYRKLAGRGEFHTVLEGGLRLLVDFDDHLDTGLFLDHRITRARIRERARGGRFLNLFAYTGTATVYAAAGGARSTTSVDLSRTYLEWAERNLALNVRSRDGDVFVQADCMEWLARQREPYDLIFLDPPTFSNSKRMTGVLDIGRDHPSLIDAGARLLAPGGLLVFSTNAQRFRLDPALLGRYPLRDVSAATLPRDFERNPRIHRCFELRAR